MRTALEPPDFHGDVHEEPKQTLLFDFLTSLIYRSVFLTGLPFTRRSVATVGVQRLVSKHHLLNPIK